MRRFLTSIMVSAALLALAGPALAADTTATSSSMMKMDKTKLKCPPGQVAVAGSMHKDGTVTKAYCRKAKGTAKSTMMTTATPKAK